MRQPLNVAEMGLWDGTLSDDWLAFTTQKYEHLELTPAKTPFSFLRDLCTSTSWLKSRASSPAPRSVCNTRCFTCSHWTSMDSRWYSSASRNVWKHWQLPHEDLPRASTQSPAHIHGRQQREFWRLRWRMERLQVNFSCRGGYFEETCVTFSSRPTWRSTGSRRNLVWLSREIWTAIMGM